MQETQFELWVPLNHASQLQHWTAAMHALDHVILTAAALESVLEGLSVPLRSSPASCCPKVSDFPSQWPRRLLLSQQQAVTVLHCSCRVYSAHVMRQY